MVIVLEQTNNLSAIEKDVESFAAWLGVHIRAKSAEKSAEGYRFTLPDGDTVLFSLAEKTIVLPDSFNLEQGENLFASLYLYGIEMPSSKSDVAFRWRKHVLRDCLAITSIVLAWVWMNGDLRFIPNIAWLTITCLCAARLALPYCAAWIESKLSINEEGDEKDV